MMKPRPEYRTTIAPKASATQAAMAIDTGSATQNERPSFKVSIAVE